jgi:hypothetical protein
VVSAANSAVTASTSPAPLATQMSYSAPRPIKMPAITNTFAKKEAKKGANE